MPVSSPWIVETTADRFVADAIERSSTVPVVVDFWAPWCHPCRLLGPILEQAALEGAGRFVLVKANTDELGEIAGQFGVQGIPAVFGLRDGAVVDSFAGLLSAEQFEAWLTQWLPTAVQMAVLEAEKLSATDAAAAAEAYRQVLETAPQELSAHLGLAKVLLQLGQLADAEQHLHELIDRGIGSHEVERLSSEIALKRKAAAPGDLDSLRQAASGGDLSARLHLAEALSAAGQYEEALATALALVQADRKGVGQDARQLMVDIFHVLGRDSEVTTSYQRRLASALY